MSDQSSAPQTGPKVFNLKFPVTFQGTRHTTLSFRRPKVKDLRVLMKTVEEDPIGANNDFLAQMSQLPPGLFDELDLEDAREINKWVEGFTKGIENSSKTGG